jgi:hypothetical protein
MLGQQAQSNALALRHRIGFTCLGNEPQYLSIRRSAL